MQIHRLLEITMILLNKDTVTARELAERFEVSPRTIYRDVEALSGAGVPVYMTKGRGGGISLLSDFSVNKALLSREDKEHIGLTLQTLKSASLHELDPSLEKLGSLFKSDADDWVQVDFTRWGSGPEEAEKFRAIKSAILQRRVVEIEYLSSQGQQSMRVIEPMRLIYKGFSWYLQGFCRLKQDFRVFRISRIQKLVIADEVFQRRQLSQAMEIDHERPGPGLVDLILKFQPGAAHRVYDDFRASQITKHPDGSFVVRASFHEDEWVYGYILSFGSAVEVLEPVYIRHIIRERLADALNFYIEK